MCSIWLTVVTSPALSPPVLLTAGAPGAVSPHAPALRSPPFSPVCMKQLFYTTRAVCRAWLFSFNTVSFRLIHVANTRLFFFWKTDLAFRCAHAPHLIYVPADEHLDHHMSSLMVLKWILEHRYPFGVLITIPVDVYTEQGYGSYGNSALTCEELPYCFT